MQKFLSSPQTEKVRLLAMDPQEGPDGFPYLMVADEGEITEPFLNLVQWCAQKGVGIVVNPQKETPDLILTYGMLWNYVVRGEFFTEAPVRVGLGDVVMENKTQLIAGHPSENFWPTGQRQIFKEFLLQQGIIQPKVIMLAEKADGPMDLAFSLESLGQPQKAEWQGILEAFSWFFPRHYSLSIVSEKNIVGLSFLPL
ncbi:hypothetical protein K2X05_02220 [bacterium]|nr:hypothetical protein [bacterium]